MLPFEILPSSSPTAPDARAARMENLGFGQVFTDHMVTVRWSVDKGWHSAKVEARKPFALDPACSILHYAQEIFEGLKAYRWADGSINMFRPEENARRFDLSAERMAMPQLPDGMFIKSIEELIAIDRDWIPGGESSLYLRPFMFASETFLGVRPSNEFIYCVIASPVGGYFKGGATTVKVWVSENYTRAAPGGTGAAKCGGNYAASMTAQAEATSHGCDQVVFLDAAEHRWIEEMGGMNIFFVTADKRLITPPLTGTILPGITRSSILTLAREEGLEVEERLLSFDEWSAGAQSGALREAFACGTAAVIASIGSVQSDTHNFTMGNGGMGTVTSRLREELVGIQRGERPDTRNWVHSVA